MGWENVFHCEWNEFGQKVLKYYWPNAISYEDITTADFNAHRGRIDVLTGGFPCQPYSAAGKRLGKADDRHLWPEMLRAIREIQPRYVVGENVYGLVNWNGGMVFEEVQTDLEAEGYQVQPVILPACAIGAPHRRDRVWFVANSKGHGQQFQSRRAENRGKRRLVPGEIKKGGESKRSSEAFTNTNDKGLEIIECKSENNGKEFQAFKRSNHRWENWPTQPPIRERDDGLPSELDGITFPKWRNESIKAFGNAIVPQVVYQIFKVIQEIENARN